MPFLRRELQWNSFGYAVSLHKQGFKANHYIHAISCDCNNVIGLEL